MLLVLALVCLTGCGEAFAGTEVVVLKVGKADAILIITPDTAIAIDAGEDEDGAEILAYLAGRKIKKLDALIITHFDKDHVGGADWVLDGIPVLAVYDADYEPAGKEYAQYANAVAAAGAPRFRVSRTLTLTFGNLSLTLMPSGVDTHSDNDLSLAISMADGYHAFFFAGDAEEARIEELLASGLEAHDVLKLPHHGRDKKNLAALVEALAPSVAVITDSDKNPADPDVLTLLEYEGVQTYSTRNGDVFIQSGEKGLTVRQ